MSVEERIVDSGYENVIVLRTMIMKMPLSEFLMIIAQFMISI